MTPYCRQKSTTRTGLTVGGLSSNPKRQHGAVAPPFGIGLALGETGKRLPAGNDASDGIVANLLRDDSAGCADSTSAALGGTARLDGLIRLLARAVGNRAHDITAFEGRTAEQLAGDARFQVAKRDPGFLGPVV